MRLRIRSSRWLLLAVCLLIVSVGLSAQTPAKRPISYDAYDGWRTIQGTKISRDGAWLVYTLAAAGRRRRTGRAQSEDRRREAPRSRARRRHHRRRQVRRVHRRAAEGRRGQGQEGEEEAGGTAEARPGRPQPRHGRGVHGDAREELQGRRKTPASSSPTCSRRRRRRPDAKDEKKEAEAKPAEPKAERAPKKPKEKKKDPGTELVVRELATGTAGHDRRGRRVRVGEGRRLARRTRRLRRRRRLRRTARSCAAPTASPGRCSRDSVTTRALPSTRRPTQLSFLSDRDTYKDNPAIYKLYYWTPRGRDRERDSSPAPRQGMPPGMVVSENGRLEFSKDGTRLFFGYREAAGGRARRGRAGAGQGRHLELQGPVPPADAEGPRRRGEEAQLPRRRPPEGQEARPAGRRGHARPDA